MNSSTRLSCEDVLDDIVSAASEPTYASLMHWVGVYPQFAAEIEAFYQAWTLQISMVDSSTLNQDQHAARSVDRAMVVLDRQARQKWSQAGQSSSLSGLAGERGLDLELLGIELGVSVELMHRLDHGEIVSETVPRKFLRELADALHVTIHDIRKLLRRLEISSLPADSSERLPFDRAVEDGRGGAGNFGWAGRKPPAKSVRGGG